jgi:GTPase
VGEYDAAGLPSAAARDPSGRGRLRASGVVVGCDGGILYIGRMTESAESRDGSAPPDAAGHVGETRAGHVALVGRPNVGKSTLLNALVGQKLSIVTPRAQTTREQVLGIFTEPGIQIIFVDTPGLLEPRYLLQQSMLQSALSALADADLVLLLLDATDPDSVPAGEALAELAARRRDTVVLINKVDIGRPAARDRLAAWTATHYEAPPLEISAARGDGLAELRGLLSRRLPVSPFLFPEDEVAVQSVRYFVSELVRETIFEEYEEEVPYATVVRVEEFREAEDPVYIRAVIYVERDSQKGILVGKGGAAIRRLGERARGKIEDFLEARVYLDLWVKPLKAWRRKASALGYLGIPVPAERVAREAGRVHHDGRGNDAGS